MTYTPPMSVKKILALPQSLARDISDYRFAHRIGTETAAIRALIEAGLKAAQQKQDPNNEKH